MFGLDTSDVLLLVLIAYFVTKEWQYRAKRDGDKNATKAFLFGTAVFGTGMFAQSQFGIQGLLAVLALLLVTVGVLVFRKR